MKEDRILKKSFNYIVLLIMFVFLLVGLSGCSKENSNEEVELSTYQENWIEDIETIRDIFSETPSIDYSLRNKKRNKFDTIVSNENRKDFKSFCCYKLSL